ncbi:MAG: molybdopterin molybdotransferase MoeA [Gloeobacteraceae cyanobacterium ES-bin-144]|nr:molybdopterin molybdotransferase MoeA [Verrucomicrobiales bacterium]
MISFPEAFKLLLQHAPALAFERCHIEHAAGRVLREDVHADRDFPPFDRVMMDGYAMRLSDFQDTRTFRLCGIAPAGRAAIVLSETKGSCIEVMTGAPLPSGADCIVPIEEISEQEAGNVLVAESFEPVAGQFIHPVGSDAREGDLLLKAGVRLGSREIGVAASCGLAWLKISALPEIAVIATGDELVAVDEVPAAHQIRQSNAHAILCALQRAGYPVARADTMGDDASSDFLRERIATCDWLILTGAVSKGARDFIPAMLDDLGCTRIFHGVAQRPGKPAGCWIGPKGQVIMALPGNPVSAITGLHAFVLPALAVASGLPIPRQRLLIPHERIDGLAGMTRHLPVVIGDDGRARAAATGNSGDFIGLLKSDGFITLPPRGDAVSAFPFTPWL